MDAVLQVPIILWAQEHTSGGGIDKCEDAVAHLIWAPQ